MPTGWEYLLRYILSNMGDVTGDGTIFRSGQPKNYGKLSLIHKVMKFNTVINLAWSPKTDDDDPREKEFCLDKGIVYYGYQWGAGGPPKNIQEFEDVVTLIDTCKKPVWVHCEGGRDRTGGAIAAWRLRKGHPLDDIFKDFCVHGMPAVGFLNYLWGKDK